MIPPVPLSNNTEAELGALTLQTGVRNHPIWSWQVKKYLSHNRQASPPLYMLDITNVQKFSNITKQTFKELSKIIH